MTVTDLRITLDCWKLGCGWSRIGWNYWEMRDEWVEHFKIHEEQDDQQA